MIGLFIDIARSRHSSRLFTEEPLSSEEMELIMEAGDLAPSSRSRRPVRLIPVVDEGLIRRLALCKDSGTRALETATFAVIVAADPDVSDVWIEDCSIASIMMQMEAEDLGLGSCWVQVRLRKVGDTDSEDFIIREAGLDPDLKILSMVAFGRVPDA